MFRKTDIFIFAIALLCSNYLLSTENHTDYKQYLKQRELAIHENENLSFECHVKLSPQEEKVAKYFSGLKEELIRTYREKNDHPSSHNFLLKKNEIEKTRLYSFIQKIPKGALLHVHSAALLTSEWLIQELTTIPDCYVYWLDEEPIRKGTLHFFPKNRVPEGYVSVEKLRAELPNFDEKLLSLLQIEKKETTSGNLWEKFEGWFTKTRGLIHYKPAFMKYYESSARSLIDDNIQYMELRALNSWIYNLDGSIESAESVIDLFSQIRENVKKKYPHFDFKIIHTEFRNSPKEKDASQLELAYLLRSIYPDFVIGYDLVGEEDTGRTTLDHAESLLLAKSLEEKYGVNLPYYFHNGESNWASNTNLYDSVLLESKRIGHGLNLFNFPYLMEKIKEQDICIEVCPISNQVLGYVSDLRIHPAALYLKSGIPCVISSDDPGLFGYHGVSPDLWEAVIAWDLDFKAIKQLCINSLKYSGMSPQEKKLAFKSWEEKWNLFIEEFCKS